MARSRAGSTAARKPSTALTAFTSFSVLVAVSVALSNGTATAPWQPAMAQDAQGPQRAGAGNDDAAQPVRASLFASAADDAAIEKATAVPASLSVAASSAPNAVGGGVSTSSTGAGNGVSSLAPSSHAAATFDGKLPVNTLIAPAQPVIVLKGGEFGWRTAPDTGQYELHNGTDISAPEGTPVVAALDGTVTAVFWDVWGGNRVEVSHANGMKTTYNHLSKIMVRVGDSLKASEQLGLVGQTGLRVTGPHLHFETWVQGKVVDAQSFDWKTDTGMIPASRSPYSTQDENSVQPTTDPNAKPGTDLGPLPDTAGLPAADRGRITALKDTSTGGTGTGGQATGGQATGGTSQSGKSSGGKQGTSGHGAGKITASGGGSGTTSPTTHPSTGTSGKGTTGSGTHQGSGTPKPSSSPAATPTAPATAKPTAPAKEQPTAPATANPTPKPSATTTPVPKPTKEPDPTPNPTGQPAAEVNPYVATVPELTTLLQLQQRTQSVLTTQLALPPAQQFGPTTVLNTNLAALDARLTALNLGTQNPQFAAQLHKTQLSVAAASTAPTDPKLTAAATADLTQLQKLVAAVPQYQPAAAPAGK